MTTIYLIRHGQDVDNADKILNGRRDGTLTPLGKRQAREVAKKLINEKIEAIYSSPLNRAYETALIIAKELGLKDVKIDVDLIEREFGVLTGKPVADIPKYAKEVVVSDGVNYFIEADGAETFPELLGRAARVLKRITDKHPRWNVIVVTHGDIGKMIIAAFHDWSWLEGIKAPYFNNAAILELGGRKDTLI